MNMLGPVMMIIPEELFGLLVVGMLIAGGLAFIVGARKLGRALVTAALALPILSVIIQAIVNDLFAFLPDWLVMPVSVILMVVCYGLVITTIFKFLVGERAWDDATGQLLADAIRWSFKKLFSRVGMATVGLLAVWTALQGVFA